MENNDDETDTAAPLIKSNEFVDKVTLEFLMNKKQFKKYVAKTDPDRHEEIEKHLFNVAKYKPAILRMTTDLLDDPEKQVNLVVNDAFDEYVRTMIRYFQTKELEPKNGIEEEDEDTLFGTMDEVERKPTATTSSQSFWSSQRVSKVTPVEHPFFSKNRRWNIVYFQ